jgi:hypothetical protein
MAWGPPVADIGLQSQAGLDAQDAGDTQEYLGRVITKNAARRARAAEGTEKTYRAVDPHQPAFHESVDVAKTFGKEYPAETQGYLARHPPERTQSTQDQSGWGPPPPTPDQLGRPIPAFRQGSRGDTQLVIPNSAEEQALNSPGEYKGKGFASSIATSLFDPGFLLDPFNISVGAGAGAVLGRSVAGAIKGAGQAVAGGYQPLVGVARGLYKGLTSPLDLPSPNVSPPEPVIAGTPGGPVTAPRSVYRPPHLPPETRPDVPQPSVQMLAQQHQAQTLSAARAPKPTDPLTPGFDPQGIQPGVEQLPTGSVTRPLTHTEQPTQHYQDSGLGYNPTGSLVRHSKPDVLSVAESRGDVVAGQPPLPGLRPQVPTESNPLFPSRMLHGQSKLPSAEDLLAQQQPQQAQRWAQLWDEHQKIADAAVPPPAPPTATKMVSEELPVLPAALPIDLRQATQAGPVHTSVLPYTESATNLQQPLPGVAARVLQNAYDVMDRMGPYSQQLGGIFRHSFDYSEQGTRQNFLDYVQLAQKLLPNPGAYARLRQKMAEVETGTVASKLDSFLNPTAKDLGLTQKQIDAIYELNEVGGDITKASAQAKATLPLQDPIVQQLHAEGWKIQTGRASSTPGIQQHATIADPITGEHFKVGPASPFNPHMPVSEKVKADLSEQTMKRIYERGNYSNTMDFNRFKELVKSHWYSDDPTIEARKFAGVEYKRLLNILDDAKAHNRTAAESARYYGYETDPLRLLVRYNQGALKRSVLLEHGDDIKALYKQLGTEYGEGSQAYKWLVTANSRTQGIGLREDLQRELNWFGKVQSIVYPSFLKFSWLQNITLQPVYAAMQVGATNMARGFWQYYGAKAGLSSSRIDELANASGANFPSFFAKWNKPDGILSQYNKTMNEVNLFQPSDLFTRHLAGVSAIPYTENLVKRLWQDPGNMRTKRLLQELNLNPDEVAKAYHTQLAQGLVENGLPVVPDHFLLRGAQVAANRSMGRTGIQALPLWATGDTVAHKSLLMLQRQLLSNTAAVSRLVYHAPDLGTGLKRGLTGLLGAAMGGYAYQTIKNFIQGQDPGDPGMNMKKAMAKLGVKGERQQEETGFMVKSLLNGMGTFGSSLMLSGLSFSADTMGGTHLPLMSSAAASFGEDILRGGMKKPGETFMRLQPLPIPPAVYKEKPRTGGTSLPKPPSAKGGWN